MQVRSQANAPGPGSAGRQPPRLEREIRALQRLHAIMSDRGPDADARIRAVLELGREVFGLRLAIVSHIVGSRYTIRHVVGPQGHPEPGTRFDVRGTYCVHTLAANGPLGFHHAGESEIRTHPCYQNFQLEAYLGVPLVVDGERYGTLNFSDPEPRAPFGPGELSLVGLFAHWIGTELARARDHAELERQRLMTESIFRDAPDAMAVTNTHRRILAVNPAFTRLFGYPAEELIGRSTDLLYAAPADYLHHRPHALAEDSSRQGLPYEVEYRRKDGRRFPGETVISLLRDPEGRLLGFLGHVRDITERKRVEKMKNDFVSTVSHELRTPLTSIRGALGLLLGGAMGELPAPMRELVMLADKNSQRLLHLINDLLDMEKIASGRLEFVVRRQPLMPLIEQAIHANRHYAGRFGVRLELVERVPDLWVDVDEDRLGQVFANLISNAAKFSPRGGRVRLGAARRGAWVRISVSDDGPGVPMEFRDKIFAKFSQADASDSRARGGTGLGLSICQAIVTRLGGRIGFDSIPGQGAQFHVDLPIRAETAADKSPAFAARASRTRP